MEFEVFNFRHAVEVLSNREAWSELQGVLTAIDSSSILESHAELARAREERGKKPPAGGQTAVNRLLKARLTDAGWISEPRLFDRAGDQFRGWKMDFLKEAVGVEVSFNHSEAIPWTFTRLNLAGESQEVLEEHRIAVGVALYAKSSLKSWARMDAAVGTFEWARDWLGLMRPIMPIPLALVGLDASGWKATDKFRGTAKGTRTRLVPD
jgi:hypothetical protein